MADVVTTFGAKDVGVAATIQRLTQRLAGFQASMAKVSAVAGRMQARFAGLRNSVVGLAAAYIGVSQALGAFNKALGVGGRLDDLSKVTGEVAGNLMLLEKSFDLSGAGADKVGMALAGMARFINDLKSGSAGASETARRLGISLADLAGKTPIEQMRVLLEAIGGVSDANERLSLSMNVFKKVGKDLIPLAVNFTGEMKKAAEFLGSTPAIMTKYADKLADVGDNMAAIGEKGWQFMTGFVAGAKGIDSMTEAMAKFDAGAAGFDIGRIVSGMVQEPKTAFLALGEILLSIMKRVGNILVDAVVHAGLVYHKFMTDPRTTQTFARNLWDGFAWALNLFNKAFYSIAKTLFKVLGSLGFPLAEQTVKEIEALQKQFDAQSQEQAKRNLDNVKTAAARFYEIAQQTPKRELNTFDVSGQDAQAKAVLDQLRGIGTDTRSGTAAAELSPVDAENRRREIQATYNEQLEAIRKSSDSSEEFGKRLQTLNQQMYKDLRDLNTRSLGNAVNQNAMPQAAREEMARQASASVMPATAQEEVASEPTLKRAVDLLAELNTKLPQPVLV